MNELRLTEEEIDFAMALANRHGVVFLLDHLGLDGLGNRVNDEKKQLMEQLKTAQRQAVAGAEALKWVAATYPKVMNRMPRALFRALREADA